LIDEKQMRECIIQPTLMAMGLYSLSAENLMVGTCVIESRAGTFVRQHKGPALGIWQMEPSTHEDIWRKWLNSYPGLLTKFMRFCLLPINKPPAELMIYHLAYACGMARILYYRSKRDIPTDIEGQAKLYKEVWNTSAGASTVEEYVDCYQEYTKQPRKKRSDAK
jgi:hypothetical protein